MATGLSFLIIHLTLIMTSLQDMGGHRTASVINSVRINQSIVRVCTTGLDEGNNATYCVLQPCLRVVNAAASPHIPLR